MWEKNCAGDMVRNITIKTLQKVLIHSVRPFYGYNEIWGWTETSFGLCSSSAENPPKITFTETWIPKPLNMLNNFPGWQIKDIHIFFIKYLFFNWPLVKHNSKVLVDAIFLIILTTSLSIYQNKVLFQSNLSYISFFLFIAEFTG